MKERLLKIQDYYLRAWKAYHNNDIKLMNRIIHNEMPVKLYDQSLNIMDGESKAKNPELQILFEETKEIITKVNKKLDDISTDYRNHVDDGSASVEEEYVADKFKGQF